MEKQPVCHIYQWVAHPTFGGVCNHCERMIEGLTIDDLVTDKTEDIVDYVQNGYPNERGWDEMPLRMTFRINQFLRRQGDIGDPDLALLGFSDTESDDE